MKIFINRMRLDEQKHYLIKSSANVTLFFEKY